MHIVKAFTLALYASRAFSENKNPYYGQPACPPDTTGLTTSYAGQLQCRRDTTGLATSYAGFGECPRTATLKNICEGGIIDPVNKASGVTLAYRKGGVAALLGTGSENLVFLKHSVPLSCVGNPGLQPCENELKQVLAFERPNSVEAQEQLLNRMDEVQKARGELLPQLTGFSDELSRRIDEIYHQLESQGRLDENVSVLTMLVESTMQIIALHRSVYALKVLAKTNGVGYCAEIVSALALMYATNKFKLPEGYLFVVISAHESPLSDFVPEVTHQYAMIVKKDKFPNYLYRQGFLGEVDLAQLWEHVNPSSIIADPWNNLYFNPQDTDKTPREKQAILKFYRKFKYNGMLDKIPTISDLKEQIDAIPDKNLRQIVLDEFNKLLSILRESEADFAPYLGDDYLLALYPDTLRTNEEYRRTVGNLLRA